MARFELDQIVRNYSQLTAEQIILFNDFYSRFDNLPAGGGNRHIANVEPFSYVGVAAGSEFLNYAVTKMYLCLRICGNECDGDHATTPQILTYNEGNVQSGRHGSMSYVHAPAAADEWTPNNIEVNNLYFSRIDVNIYTYIIFIGFRITLD